MNSIDGDDAFGRFVGDAVEDKYMILVNKLDKLADNVQVGYDYNCNPLTVYDYNKDKGIDVEPDEPVYTVVFPKVSGLEHLSKSNRLELIDSLSHKEYFFPESRIKTIDESVIESEENELIESIGRVLADNKIYHKTYNDMVFTKDSKAKEIFAPYDDVVVRELGDFYVGMNYL